MFDFQKKSGFRIHYSKTPWNIPSSAAAAVLAQCVTQFDLSVVFLK